MFSLTDLCVLIFLYVSHFSLHPKEGFLLLSYATSLRITWAVPEKVAQERRARHRQQVKLHKRIWKLYQQGYHKGQIAQIAGVSSSKVYRTLEQEAPPPPR